MVTIPFEDKQIAYVSYDSATSSMLVHFHTGKTLMYQAIPNSAIQMFQDSENKVDVLAGVIRTVQITT